jgi:hypothetical protein
MGYDIPSTGVNVVKVKVKCTLVQALRLRTDRTAHRESRGIALLFHDHRHYKGVRGQRHAPAALYPRKRPGTHCTGGWVGPRPGLDRCGKARPHRNSIPGPSSQSIYQLRYSAHCECGGKDKITISRISFIYLGQTKRKAFPYLRKNHLKVIIMSFQFVNMQEEEEMVNTGRFYSNSQ